MAQNKKKQGLQGVTDRASAEQAMQQAAYEKSQAVLDAQAQLEQHLQQKPGEYVSGYQEKIDGMMDQILHREGFSYDFTADPLYQGYKNQYVHQGRLAMQDSLAGAAALTGGYGSSYAAAAGSQAYQNQLNQLHEKIPALYQAALDRYDAEGSHMQQALEQLLGADKQAQQAHQNKLDNYFKELEQYTELADSAYEKDYGAYRDQLDALADLRDYYAGQEQQAFQREQAQQAHALAVKKYEDSVRRWQAEQAAEAARQAADAARQAEDARRWQAQLANNRAAWQAQLADHRAKWQAELENNQTKWQAELEFRRQLHGIEPPAPPRHVEPKPAFGFESVIRRYQQEQVNDRKGEGLPSLTAAQQAEARLRALQEMIYTNRLNNRLRY